MKTFTKFLAVLLVLCVFAACFVACDKETETNAPGNNGSNNSTESGEVGTEFFPDVAQKNYGTELYMQTYPGDSILKYMYTEEGEGDVVTEALYARQQKLQDYLGVELIATAADGDNGTYCNAFTNSVKNKDGAIDLFVPQAYVGVVLLVQGGYVQNLKNVDGLDLEAEYWNYDFMDSISLYDRFYLGYGDFCIAETHVITYNKTMMQQYADSMTESVYDSVRNYHWTFGQMIALADLVYADANSDGKTEDDTYGMSGRQWIPFIGFLHASDIQLVEPNEKGDYEVSVFNDKNKEKTVALIDMLSKFAASDSAWFRFRIEPTPVIELKTNRVLMVLHDTKGLDSLLSTGIEFGVLPYPMYDEEQKDVGYRHLNYDGYVTIPSYSKDIEMVANSLELLQFWGGDVTVAVYEKLLGKQVADTPDDAQMLSIVWDTLCSDFGLTYSTISDTLDNNLYMLPWLTNPNGTDQVASYVEKYSRNADKAIGKFMKQMKDKP